MIFLLSTYSHLYKYQMKQIMKIKYFYYHIIHAETDSF